MKPLTIDVPATSANLGPGFDSLGVALDMADRFSVDEAVPGEGVTMDNATSTAAGVAPSDHYACAAYRAYAAGTGIALPDVRFTLHSGMPQGKGFGSSAAATVAGLAAAAHIAGRGDDSQCLLRLAASLEGHPDNSSAAILGGITAAYCDGDDVYALNVANHTSIGVAVYVPDRPLPTKEARAVLPTEVRRVDAVYNVSRTAYLTAALAWGRWEALAPAMSDRLHQPYRSTLLPALDHVIDAALSTGAHGSALSGGGPAVIAFGPQERITDIAAAMETEAHRRNWPGQSLVTGVRSRGVRVSER